MGIEKYVEQPAPNTKIWRYMTFGKFMSLLERRSLFFMQLRILEDKYEGYISGIPSSEIKKFIDLPNAPHSYCVVSCWSMSDTESDTMWKTYTSGDEGVAIQSTVDRLNCSLNHYPFTRIYTGMVAYCDPPEPKIEPGPEGVPFEANCFYKRTSFIAEREYRILGRAKDFELTHQIGGVFALVDLNILIESVHISPKSPKWLLELTQSVVNSKGISAKVKPSDLTKDPYD